MNILLIGNYPPDGQQSMERFARMLESGLKSKGHAVGIVRPAPFFGRWARTTTTGLGKWLGYIDKWLVFPLLLRVRHARSRDAWFHVCDHSNATYLAHLPAERTSITCHDVLAIRGALGHADAWCRASRFGVILQKWILAHLCEARNLAADSDLTMRQLRELAPDGSNPKDWRVIPIAFNDAFAPMPKEEAEPLLCAAGVHPDEPYLLHVGSALPRKNRGMLVKMVAVLGDRWAGRICFAGAPPDPDLLRLIKECGLGERVDFCPRPDHQTLLALYSQCEAFVFPSYSEGFGWPVIEAQACGAPVIASSTEPMPEVSGGKALHVDPDDTEGFASALLQLRDTALRAALAARGFENCRRFAPETMIEAYLALMGRTSPPTVCQP